MKKSPKHCQSLNHDTPQNCFGKLRTCRGCRLRICYADGAHDDADPGPEPGQPDRGLCDTCASNRTPRPSRPATIRGLGLAAIVTLLGACAPPEAIPGFDSRLVCNLDDCSRWTPELVGERLQDWRDRWVVLFDETPPAPATITVDAWGPGIGPGGYRAWNTDDIHVAAEFEGRPLEVWESSLAHEATHSALWVLTGGRHGGDGDRNHAVGDGPWTETHDVLIFTATREPLQD